MAKDLKFGSIMEIFYMNSSQQAMGNSKMRGYSFMQIPTKSAAQLQ